MDYQLRTIRVNFVIFLNKRIKPLDIIVITGICGSLNTNNSYRVIVTDEKEAYAANCVRVNNKVIPPSTRQSVLTFSIFFFALVFVGWFFYLAIGIDIAEAYGISLSCLSNIGLTIGYHGCNIPWDDMPTIGKWFSTFLMLIGRLEVFSVLLIITPSFWKHR